MPNFKELRFKIEGKTDDVDFTPTTLPMARLAEYLTDLAVLLGHKESIHLIKVEDGSAQPLFYYDVLEEGRIFARVRGAANGTGDPEAVEAFQKIDKRLRRDNGSARLVNGKADLADFPGIRQEQQERYPKIRERRTIVGKLRRVGGRGDTIPIWIERADHKMFFCDTSEALSKRLSEFYLQVIKVHGIGIYIRSENDEWEQDRFIIQSFDPAPLLEEDIRTTFDKLRAIDDNEWNQIKDPLAELRRIRHGDDESTQ